ncbi:MAG: TonB-dependent receptor [Bacteroidota bacterium]
MKIRCIIWALLLSLAGEAFADHGSLKGRILDAQSQEPLAGAFIQVKELSLSTLADEAGNFFLPSLPVGDVELAISFLGYLSQDTILNIRAEQQTELFIALEGGEIQLEAITIEGRPNVKQTMATIQALDLQLRPLQNSQQALQAIPGLFIAQHAGGGKAEQIFLRGFDIDHGTDIQLSVEGMPVNMVSHAHGQGYADLHFLIPETIERVETEKGPYAASKGNFATAGYADFQLKRRLDQNLLEVGLGQFGQQRVLGMMKVLDKKPGQHAYVATELSQHQGYFESPQDFFRLNLLGRYEHSLSPDHRFTLTLSHFQSSWDASGQIPMRAVEQGLISRFGAIDDTEGGDTRRSNLLLQWHHHLPGGGHLRHQFSVSQYQFSLFSNFTFFLEDSINGDQIWQHEDRLLLHGQSEYEQTYQFWNLPMQSRIGLQWRQDHIADSELAQTRNRYERLQSLSRGDIAETNAAVYVDQQIDVSPKVNLQLGLRYDQMQFRYEDALEAQYQWQRLDASLLSPKLQLQVQALPNLNVYLQAGQGFHANDSRSLTHRMPRSMMPRAWGADLGWLWKPSEHFFLQAAVWALRMEQEFVYVGDAGIVEPSGQSMRSGLDLSGRWAMLPWLYADVDLTYSHARSLEGEESFIPLAPVWTGTAGLSVRRESWQASLRGRLLGDRPANEDYSLTAGGYMLLDAVVRRAFGPCYVEIQLENILNTAWEEAQFETTSLLKGETEPVTEIHFTPGTPFQVRAALGWRF